MTEEYDDNEPDEVYYERMSKNPDWCSHCEGLHKKDGKDLVGAIWGCERYPWKELNAAQGYIIRMTKRFGRFYPNTKEKYGRYDIGSQMGVFRFLEWGCRMRQLPKWWKRLITKKVAYTYEPILNTGETHYRTLKEPWVSFQHWIILYQIRVFQFFIKRAAKKFPKVGYILLEGYNDMWR